MTTRTGGRKVWASLVDIPRHRRGVQPPRGRDGYPWPRLVLASLLGVRLPVLVPATRAATPAAHTTFPEGEATASAKSRDLPEPSLPAADTEADSPARLSETKAAPAPNAERMRPKPPTAPEPRASAPTGALPAQPTTPPYASEATRLLCAGTYLDTVFRDQVIEELHLNEQRVAAPSLGFDATRVLAHALQARRQELQSAGLAVGLWTVGLAFDAPMMLLLLWPSVLLCLAPRIRGRGQHPPLHRRTAAFFVRWWGRVFFTAVLLQVLIVAAGGADNTPLHSSDNGLDLVAPGNIAGTTRPWQAWLTLAVLTGIAASGRLQRIRFSRTLAGALSSTRFPDAAADPAEYNDTPRFRRLEQRIRTEQHSPLIMYHQARPFCGAGTAHDTWVLSVELRSDEEQQQQPLNNRIILDTIRPLLEQLRLPAEYAVPNVRDRLRQMEIDECVFLPVDGLPARDSAPYSAQAFQEHRARAVEEEGEKRRHFLRARVSGWEEEVVVTVFVRIHMGHLLTLEIAPHVLTPLRQDFKDADRIAHKLRNDNWLNNLVAALLSAPGAVARSMAQLWRQLGYEWRMLTGGHASTLPEGPTLSVRELGATPAESLFQEMDVIRYIRAIQHRVVNGVWAALTEAGYDNSEFAQKVLDISNGAVRAGRVDSSGAAGQQTFVRPGPAR